MLIPGGTSFLVSIDLALHQTKLSVNQWVIHRSVDLFGMDADVFSPDRWLGDREQAIEQYYIPIRQ